mmetsp:Transcript_29481/g.64408  ORF Transcript_29481/g.64408 Transcript_29481/m.64408 type:complete len:122 (-) Transcript_29481:330-695(-)|eukprot:CAMPEP_0118933518 /NCGR_PEP_ID=MMETSP1169-20130426/12033_1 /TAXON_ID=36882 /ORGANISM="Pyramimonas obovata, Strain CCMP722" /LENGTH=121 /DNA_ID=CAMNT_0006876289 /DNA_START=194 /DNA_END=559 /DNA_ORIENTATION=+
MVKGRRDVVFAQRNSDGTVERQFLSMENVQKNMRAVVFCRTFISIVAGIVAGILGLTNVAGFTSYFVMMGMVSLGLAARTNFDPTAYYPTTSKITYDGITSGLMTFVLFWTLFYDIVHIYG